MGMRGGGGILWGNGALQGQGAGGVRCCEVGMRRAGIRWGRSILGTGNRGDRSERGWSMAGPRTWEVHRRMAGLGPKGECRVGGGWAAVWAGPSMGRGLGGGVSGCLRAPRAPHPGEPFCPIHGNPPCPGCWGSCRKWGFGGGGTFGVRPPPTFPPNPLTIPAKCSGGGGRGPSAPWGAEEVREWEHAWERAGEQWGGGGGGRGGLNPFRAGSRPPGEATGRKRGQGLLPIPSP